MELRWYQLEAIDAIYNYFLHGAGNPIVAMPTGTGKSIVIAEFVRSVFSYYKGQRIMMLTHVKELIDQNFKELIGVWPLAPAGIYSAGLGRKENHAPITFAGIKSVVDKPELFGKVNLILIDECHMLNPKEETSYQKFITELKKINPHLKVIGFTATPYRLGQGMLTTPANVKGKELAPLFTDICYDITALAPFNRLIAEGYLCKLVPRPQKTELNVSNVSITGGEFNLEDLQAAVDKDEITNAAIEETLACAGGRNHWLVFATGIEHAQHICDRLNERGVPATCVHSKLSKADRDQRTLDFKSGKYVALVNNGVFTTGFNFPKIDLIVMLRPTNSAGLWVQMLGRGTRMAPGKENCLVLDFAGNTKRLGPINDPLIPKPKGKGKGQPAPVKLCETCGTYNHASVRVCDFCGAEFTFITKLVEQAGTQELLAGEAPQVEIFQVNSLTYSTHQKQGSPDSLKVTYFCGLRQFSEWVCLEHSGAIGHKARKWWIKRLKPDPFEIGSQVPSKVSQALDRIEDLESPTHLRIWINKKYPQIMDADFSGTGWGTEKAKIVSKPKARRVEAPKAPAQQMLADEDVPF